MNLNEEIKMIIEELASRKKYSTSDSDKLLHLFSNVELNVPDSLARSEHDPSRFRQQDSAKKVYLFPQALNIARNLRRAALPAAAVIIVLILAGTGLDLFQRGSSATAYAVRGNVEVMRGSDRMILKKGDRVYQDDLIITGDSSCADFTLNRTIRLRCQNNSRVILKEITPEEKAARFSAMIRQGSLFLYIDKLQRGSMVSVTTPETEAVVRGTLFGVRLGKKGAATFEVYDGKIRVKNRIPDEYSNMDTALAEKLESFYEKNSYVVSRNDYCTIAPNSAVLKGLTEENITGRLEKISIPAVVPGGVKNFTMKSEVEKFVTDAIKEKTGPGLREIRKAISSRDKVELPGEKVFNRKQIRGFASPYIVSPSHGNYVIIIDSRGSIIATDLKRIIWKQNPGGEISTRPILHGNILYVSTDTERLTAYNADSGTTIFSIPLPGAVSSFSGPFQQGGSLYAATTRGHLYRISLNGKIIWDAAVDGIITAAPFKAGHLVFVPLKGGVLMGLDCKSGVKILRVPFRSEIIATAALENNIYVSVKGGRLYSFNYYMDRILWEFNTEAGINQCIVADNDSLYLCNKKGTVFRLSKSGKLIWQAETGDSVRIGPEIDDRYVYVAGSEVLQVIDRSTGDIIWAIGLSPITARNIALSENKIYVLSEKRGLIVLKK